MNVPASVSRSPPIPSLKRATPGAETALRPPRSSQETPRRRYLHHLVEEELEGLSETFKQRLQEGFHEAARAADLAAMLVYYMACSASEDFFV